jgi:hypothetical protein
MKAQLSGNLGGLGNFGIWSGPATALEQALRMGAPAPAVSPASTLSSLGSPVINHSGEIAVPARVSFSGGADNLVYIGAPDDLEVFIRDGDVLPDLQPNESLNAPASVNINDNGQLAFRAVIRPPQGSLTSVWAGVPGNLSLLARQGEPAPDTESGVTFGAISDLTDVFINRDGEVLFQANLGGLPSGEKALFAGTAGNLGLLARTDLGVPGAGGPSIPGFHAYAINSEAQVAFFTGGSNVSALWMGQPGNVQLIAAPGTVVDGGPKGLRTITSFFPTIVSGGSGNEDGHPSFFSDNGQIVFSARFGGPVAILISAPTTGGTDTPPDTSITGGPTGSITVNSATFTWTGSDDSTPTESLLYAYRLDPIEPSFSAFASETTKSYSNLPNGSYTFFVKAKDLAENEDPTPASRSFMVGGAGPDVTVTPTSIAFGSVAVGDRSADNIVTVTNDGTANLIITTISLGGTNPAQFERRSDKCSKKTLTPGASCTVAARFKPTSSGAKTATLIIPANDPDENPVNVTLSGTGGSGGGDGSPDVTITPSAVNFGNVTVGNKSADQITTVRNDGTANLTIGPVSLTGANSNQFVKASDNCSKKVLAPAASCTVAARFKPTSTGVKTTNLVIPSNDPDENQVNVSLTGTGTP